MSESESAGRRTVGRDELVEEARRAAYDPDDRAELRAVMQDMEAIAADWPDDNAER